MGPKGGGGSGDSQWGEWLLIFMELGSSGNYFRGGGEHDDNFWDLGSPAKK